MKYFKRDKYTDKIRPFVGKDIIKVLTGQRRVGKSYILYQLMDEIKVSHPDANIIYINCELEEFREIKSSRKLYKYVDSRLVNDRALNYLFIDEIQEISDFQHTLRSLLAEQKCDIYCTGSNANLLSGELATFLSGRYIEINIHSLSYREFLRFHQLENSPNALGKYLTYGGLPFLINLELSQQQSFEYLRNVYSAVLLKDVVARENIRNVSFLENLVSYLADNVGNLCSALNISKYLKAQRIEMNPQIIINYLKALTNAFFVHKVVRADVQGFKIFETGEKYYFEDLGLRNVIGGFNAAKDVHKIMENAVYLHLLQCGYKVYVGKLDNKEIDFVAENNGRKLYVQVSLTVINEDTRQREFDNLMLIGDNYPKYMVTLNDMLIGTDYKGIQHINLADFLYTNFE
ncbi:ATPase [Bacteroidia bacterium]|nr:ATPase [Bacteroidia bacterium]